MIASRSSGRSAPAPARRTPPPRVRSPARAATRGVDLEPVETGRVGPPPLPPQLVAQAVEHRLPQIGLQRADAARLEPLNPLKRPEQGVLDKVVGVGQVAGPPGQAAAGPALERLEVAREQAVERVVVAGAGASIRWSVDSGPRRVVARFSEESGGPLRSSAIRGAEGGSHLSLSGDSASAPRFTGGGAGWEVFHRCSVLRLSSVRQRAPTDRRPRPRGCLSASSSSYRPSYAGGVPPARRACDPLRYLSKRRDDPGEMDAENRRGNGQSHVDRDRADRYGNPAGKLFWSAPRWAT